MYKIPLTFDISNLIGKQIQQVCFSINTVTLSFGVDEFINIETEFSIDKHGNSSSSGELYPVSTDYGLLELMEKSILRVEINESRDGLALTFDDNIILRLNSKANYESFSIKIGKEKILV